MGIYIKDLAMPTSCKKCPFTCEKLVFFDGKNRPQGCPLIEIPTPHGRLIDASELIKSYMKGTKADIDDFYDTIDIIDNAPTILEAER